jgi:hypothetical protein
MKRLPERDQPVRSGRRRREVLGPRPDPPDIDETFPLRRPATLGQHLDVRVEPDDLLEQRSEPDGEDPRPAAGVPAAALARPDRPPQPEPARAAASTAGARTDNGRPHPRRWSGHTPQPKHAATPPQRRQCRGQEGRQHEVRGSPTVFTDAWPGIYSASAPRSDQTSSAKTFPNPSNASTRPRRPGLPTPRRWPTRPQSQ